MSTTTEKTCLECGTPLSAERSTKRFCDDKCRGANYRKNKKTSLGDVVTVRPTSTMNTRDLKSPVGLDPSAQFIIDTIKEQRDELKATVKEQAAEIKQLTKEKADLEKERDTATSELEKKPSGLSGILQDKDNVTNLLTHGPAIIKEFAGLLKEGFNAVTPQQLGTGAQQTPTHPIVEWMEQHPLDIQQDFVDLMAKLQTLTPAELKQKLTFFSKQTASSSRSLNGASRQRANI